MPPSHFFRWNSEGRGQDGVLRLPLFPFRFQESIWDDARGVPEQGGLVPGAVVSHQRTVIRLQKSDDNLV